MLNDGGSAGSNVAQAEWLGDRSSLGWLRERDIDLLVCSELHADGAVTRLLATRLNSAVKMSFEGAWVSHAEVDGESDLVVAFQSDAGYVLALIENKIAAAFQPEQGARYRARATRWNKLPSIAAARTVLLSPKSYAGRSGAEEFDLHLSYEDVAEAAIAEGDPRALFLAKQLSAAVDGLRRAYVAIPDAAATNVWLTCWRVATDRTPELHMPKPVEKPGQSNWIYFREAAGLAGEERRRVVVVYKAERGQADLQFASTTRDGLEKRCSGLLEPGMEVVAAAKSASVRVRVPEVDFLLGGEGQEAAIETGLRTCERLRRFLLANRAALLGG